MDKYQEILRQYWGYDDFRALQGDIIRSVGAGVDTLGLMPTGGGKSITFQVPALAMEGICIVVTPLIALMKDQVENLRARNIKAAAVYSGMSHNEIVVALDNCIFGGYKFLYVSPERLATDIFIAKLQQMKVCLLAVDESHCISQWGYDFRPSYLKIADIRSYIPDVPVLALTATATPEVVEDIQRQLHFKEGRLFKKSFSRKNIAYIVRQTDDKMGQMFRILAGVPGTSIVYVRSRKKTKEISDILNAQGVTADFYHAGLQNDVKDQKQQAWKSGECRVIVATNAFGMGIDKPDVRTVIHLDLPDTLEAYFQEAGRAGRDEQQAYAILLYNKSDNAKLLKRVADGFPEKEFIERVYNSLCNFYEIGVGYGMDSVFDFSLGEFCSIYKLPLLPTHSAMKILEHAGYLELTDDEEHRSRVMFIVDRRDLYNMNLEDPFHDELMKTLLRSYTGLFAEYAFVDEALLAKRLNATRDEVYKGLLFLSKWRVINYVPGKKTPVVIFSRARVELRHLVIGKDSYEVRKKRFSDRIESVLAYAQSQNRCRSRMLLHYFGEEKSEPCGCCDYCLGKRQRALSSVDFGEIRAAVSEFLKDGPMPIPALLTCVGYDEAKVVEALRFMQDAGDLKMDSESRLSLP